MLKNPISVVGLLLSLLLAGCGVGVEDSSADDARATGEIESPVS